MNSARQRALEAAAQINAAAAGEPERIERWIKNLAAQIKDMPTGAPRVRKVIMMTDGMAAAASLRAMQCARMRYSQAY